MKIYAAACLIFCALCGGCVLPPPATNALSFAWRDVSGDQRSDGALKADGIVCNYERSQAMNRAELTDPMPKYLGTSALPALVIASSYSNHWRQLADSAFSACMANRGWILEQRQAPTIVRGEAPGEHKSDRCSSQQIRMDQCPD